MLVKQNYSHVLITMESFKLKVIYTKKASIMEAFSIGDTTGVVINNPGCVVLILLQPLVFF